jgi:VWFA-related protein
VDQIDQACQSLSAELRRRYTLGYYPQNKARDGKYRRIRVDVKKEKLKVRARDGYFAPRA